MRSPTPNSDESTTNPTGERTRHSGTITGEDRDDAALAPMFIPTLILLVVLAAALLVVWARLV